MTNKFPEFSLIFPENVRKFNEKYFPFNEVAGKLRSGSSSQLLLSGEVCNIHKGHYNQSANEHNLDTWYKTHISQNGETLSLLGHLHKFPEFP